MDTSEALHRFTLRSRMFCRTYCVLLDQQLWVWLGLHSYPASWNGLMACHAAGIPFYGNSLVSTILFAGILFGLQHFYALRVERSRGSHAIVG